MTRIGIFGWGLVAPKSPNIDSFARNLALAESWLSPFNGFGPDNFLVGTPEFDVGAYSEWVDERFPPNRFPQLVDKMDPLVQYAIGAFIQSLAQNPGIEQELKALGTAAHVYVGTGLGALPTQHRQSLALHRAQRRWDRFWCDPSRNRALADHLKHSDDERSRIEAEVGAPADPDSVEEYDREEAEDAWWHFWAERSEALAEYLDEQRRLESIKVEGDIASGKLSVIKEKRRRFARLQKKWGSPEPPWRAVSANLLWNIPNIAAAQISMLGQITGMSFAPVAACSTFGICLKLAMDSIRRGEAKLVVVGATDPPPHPLTVGGFYNARVISADAQISKPLSEMRGTHVAGGSVIWLVGDYDYLSARGFRTLGMEPLSVGVTSDADHIITPSKEGPAKALSIALHEADQNPDAIETWDLHATATPGDFTEVETLREVLPDSVLVTARKGLHGHGMSASGGWEMTAQYLGYEHGHLYPTTLAENELNDEIRGVHNRFLFDSSCPAPRGPAGKMSMGIGGINACIISRPWDR